MATASASAPAARVPPGANLWVVLALVWHGILGVGMVALGVLALLGVSLGDVLVWPEPFVRLLIFGVGVGLGGVQLLSWPGLRAYRSRARVVALAIDFAGLLLGLFVTFRQMTCINTCRTDPAIFAPDRLATWLPFFVLTLAFGVVAYGLWRRDVADLFKESSSLRSALTAYIYISPYLLTAAIFTVGLLIYAFTLSFTNYGNDNLYGGVAPQFVGLDNYARAFQDDEFLIAISNVIWYALIVVVFQTIISLGLAMMMNGRFKGRRMFRTLFYAPSVTSSVVISLIFLWLFNGQGIVNYIVFEVLGLTEPLGNLGLRTPNTNWLNTPTRLGDLIYLKPFFDGSWAWLVAIPLALLLIGAGARAAVWLRDRAIHRRAALIAGGAGLAAAAVLIALLAVLFPLPVGDSALVILGDLTLWALVIALVTGAAGGLAATYARVEGDRDALARNSALGVLAAAVIGGIAALILGAAALPGAVSPQDGANVALPAALLIPALIAPWMAALAARIAFGPLLRSGQASEAARPLPPGGDARRPLDRIAAALGPGWLALLAVLAALAILVAAATSGATEPTDLGAEEFGPLLLRGPSVAFLVVMLLNIFTTSPTFMIMFLAALQDIPGQLYEAAQIDGANRRQQFFNVTLPMLRPVMLLIVVLGTIGTFQIFDQIHVMTSGGPLNTTLTPVYLIFTKAIGDQRAVQMGYAAAMAFILGAIIFVITYIQRNYIERGTQQY